MIGPPPGPSGWTNPVHPMEESGGGGRSWAASFHAKAIIGLRSLLCHSGLRAAVAPMPKHLTRSRWLLGDTLLSVPPPEAFQAAAYPLGRLFGTIGVAVTPPLSASGGRATLTGLSVASQRRPVCPLSSTQQHRPPPPSGPDRRCLSPWAALRGRARQQLSAAEATGREGIVAEEQGWRAGCAPVARPAPPPHSLPRCLIPRFSRLH